MFIMQCEDVLKSKNVRYYFKCAVFEVIGQCEDPNEAILKLAKSYLHDAEWSDYVFEAIYYGHPVFVIDLENLPHHSWMEDKNLRLLGSISIKNPDYVTSALELYTFDTIGSDQRIFRALCHDAINDSDSMFGLRLKLLEHTPSLFDKFWGFSSLIEKLSVRAISIMKIIIEKSSNCAFGHFHFGKDESLKEFAQTRYEDIIDELFGAICQVTASFEPPQPFFGLDDQRHEWASQGHDKSVVRIIVEIIKDSFAEFFKNKPIDAISYINNPNYLNTIVGHEIVMHGLQNLPTKYSNDAIKWLLGDFNNRVFEYMSNPQDYLSYAKKIIERFSPFCSEQLFSELESRICSWKESTERMVSIYERRLEINGERNWPPIYYAYWGHFQKELLPVMCSDRLSTYSKELLAVLSRNTWIQTPFYYSGFSLGYAKSVTSPIHEYTDKITDKRWLEIVSTPNEKMRGRWRGKETSSFYIEATHESFSSALAKQAKLQPARFARLSLSFAQSCYYGYISSVIGALADQDESGAVVDIKLTSDVIMRYEQIGDRNIDIEIARLLEKRSNEAWADNIIDIIEDLALNHPDPEKNRYAITSNSDPENLTPHSLLTNSINCVRGCALHTIAAFLWNHRELSERFKTTIQKAVLDTNDAVRFAALSCILPFYNIDSEFSVKQFKNLITLDLKILGAHEAWQIISRDYNNSPEYYRQALLSAANSDIDELSEHAAGLICAIAVFFEDSEALTFITEGQYTTKQADKICIQAAASFNTEEHHDISKKILLHLIKTTSSELNGLNRLFFDRCLNIERDKDFLFELMQSKHSVRLIHSFLDYLNESDEDIMQYADILKAIGTSLSSMPSELSYRFVVSDLIKCVIRLFDRGKGDLIVRGICLDIWDDLFKSNLQDVQPLSDMIDEFV